MEKRRYIRRMLRMAALAVGMLVGGASAWGQRDLPNNQWNYESDYDFSYNRPNNRIVNKNQSGFSEVTEILYVMPGQSIDIALQFYSTHDNLNGYIRWYLEGDTKGDGTTDHLERNTTSEDFGLVRYANGYAWFRYEGGRNRNLDYANGDYITPYQVCYITYNCPSIYDDSNPDVVVCEASSLTDFDEPITGFNNTRDSREAPTLGVRKRYIIKSAVGIRTQLNTFRQNIVNSGNTSWLTSANGDLPSTIINNPSGYFKEVYTIHTPIWPGGKGTTYRLDKQTSNYYVGSSNVPVSEVRWRTFDETGDCLSSDSQSEPNANHARQERGWANIFNHQFNLSGNLTVTHTRYVTAEVRNSNGDWYPVSFFKVLLEPNIVPMTRDELNNDDSYASVRRRESILANPNRYELLEAIRFDDETTRIPLRDLEPTNNVAVAPYDADTYYAFSYASRWSERGRDTRTTGRGEYSLYRTLNYSGVSQSGQHYGDYFMSRYNHWAVDRTYDTTGGEEIGYFFFVDAADEPGVIANIDLNTKLCPSTSLIVTAWVCNLLHYDSDPAGADLGITFKGVDGQGNETILDKYYSGELGRKEGTATVGGTTQAAWQQIYFSFTTDREYPMYRIEIANNSRSSNGADYGIDDICVYRSLPDITVARQDACESSQLYVSSDYQTILNNMGWYLDADVLEITPGIDIENDFDARKYRYGFLTNNIVLNPTRVGNVYFGVLDGEKYDAGQVEWVVVNNRLKDSDNPQVARLANVIRAVVPTNLSSEFERFPDNEARAQAMEVEINIQAMRDYNSDIEADKFSDRISTPIELGDSKYRIK